MLVRFGLTASTSFPEAVVQRCSIKWVFLKISQNSLENTCARVSFLIKLQASPATLLKKRLCHRYFPVNFAKFSRTPLLIEHIRWLLLVFLYFAMFRYQIYWFIQYYSETDIYHEVELNMVLRM